MISTLLIEVPWLPVIVLAIVVLAAPLLVLLLARHRTAARVLLAADLLAVLALTLTPEPDGALPDVRCAVGLPHLSPTSVESVANVLLLVPTALLLGSLLRRPGLAVLLTLGISVVVETVQALLPAIGRACDTGDLITNGIGALLGGAGAVAGLALADRGARPSA